MGCFRWATLVAVSVAVLSAQGCAQIGEKDRANRLDQSVRLYVNSIRWGNFETASGLLKVRTGEQPALNTSALANLKVTAYSSRVVAIDETAGEAQVATSFDYYFLDSGTVRSVSQNAVWWFDGDNERWFLDGTLPDFRR